jgi:hypothetical protein
MELEERYLSTLPGVSRFGFLNGKLALSWQQDGGVNSLLFAPRTP